MHFRKSVCRSSSWAAVEGNEAHRTRSLGTLNVWNRIVKAATGARSRGACGILSPGQRKGASTPRCSSSLRRRPSAGWWIPVASTGGRLVFGDDTGQPSW